MVASKVGKRYAFTGFDALRELFEMRLALLDSFFCCLLAIYLFPLEDTLKKNW